ncbi:MAG: CAAD domain-containing protein [Leptolyngbyaceae cyanobacterium T60_A2020_046]|nr:CAAD domain-containing protein [Leptolyngbyaceae cyanobacterium T60_A2020_046]
MSTDFKSEATMPEPDNTVNSNVSGVSASSTGGEITEQLQAVWGKVSSLLADLPDYVTDFFKEYQRPLITVGLILGAVVSVKLLLAVLGAVNEIPLLAPTFELIGLGYSGWFVYRFLLRDANRQELLSNLNSLKEQVLGRRG